MTAKSDTISNRHPSLWLVVVSSWSIHGNMNKKAKHTEPLSPWETMYLPFRVLYQKCYRPPTIVLGIESLRSSQEPS